MISCMKHTKKNCEREVIGMELKFKGLASKLLCLTLEHMTSYKHLNYITNMKHHVKIFITAQSISSWDMGAILCS